MDQVDRVFGGDPEVFGDPSVGILRLARDLAQLIVPAVGNPLIQQAMSEVVAPVDLKPLANAKRAGESARRDASSSGCPEGDRRSCVVTSCAFIETPEHAGCVAEPGGSSIGSPAVGQQPDRAAGAIAGPITIPSRAAGLRSACAPGAACRFPIR